MLQTFCVDLQAYARITTNHGGLNLQLDCDLVPKTCEKFLDMSEDGHYNGARFGRCMKGYMIETSEPEGKEPGEKLFSGEFTESLKHNQRGILSTGDNGLKRDSRFFILFKASKHLEGKCTPFGKVVGGLETLTSMEGAEVSQDGEYMPLEPIMIHDVQVLLNPYHDIRRREREEEERRAKEAEGKKRRAWFSDPAEARKAQTTEGGVGKYLKKSGGSLWS